MAARHCGLRVLGLSLITNAAPPDPDDDDEAGAAATRVAHAAPAGDTGEAAAAGHDEVLAAAQAGAGHLRELLRALAPRLAQA